MRPPSVKDAETIAFDRIKNLVADVLKIVREVDEWRNEHDPGSQEWYTLCNLADTAGSLAMSLPVEMLPEAETRYVDPGEYAVSDALLDLLADIDKESGK